MAVHTLESAVATGLLTLPLLVFVGDVAGLIGIGFVVSFISGLFVVRFLVDFVGRFGFAPFSAWRILVGTVGLLAIWLY